MSDDFFLQGSNQLTTTTNSDHVAKGLAIICGQETLTFSESTNAVFDIFISSTSDDKVKFSLTEIWIANHPKSYVEQNSICGIKNFKICPSLLCSEAWSNTNLSISGSELSIDIS